MNTTPFKQIKNWMGECGQVVGNEYRIPELQELILRQHLIEEEFGETNDELEIVMDMVESGETPSQENIAKLSKELADMLVVVYGGFASLGIDGDKILQAVIDNNNEKLENMVYEDNGKATTPPDVKKELKEKIHNNIINILEDRK